MFGHPPGARQMALPSSVRARRLCGGIDMQYQAGYLGPIGARGLRIKEPHISDEMFLIVSGQGLGVRGKISNGRIERRLSHMAACVPNDRAVSSKEHDQAIAIHICRAATTSYGL